MDHHDQNLAPNTVFNNSTQLPNPNPSPCTTRQLRPSSSSAFKHDAKKKRKDRKRAKKLAKELDLLALGTCTRSSSSSSLSAVEWPCNEINSDPKPQSNEWLWASWPANPNPRPQELSLAPLQPQPQDNALKQCQEFLAANDDSDDEGDEPCRFFVELFENDESLRGFYQRSWENGNFFCLVCAGIGEKIGKRYANCVGIVQHAHTVGNTTRRLAHRDYGRALRRVL